MEIFRDMSKSRPFLGCVVVVNVSTLLNNVSLILLVPSKRLNVTEVKTVSEQLHGILI